jgi:mRNA interferase RelE/StbE
LGFKVIYSEAASKQIERLDKPLQKRVLAFVDKIEASVNPRFSGKALKGNDKEWRYRVGDYRLICEIKDSELIVWIVRIGNRREVYR